MKGMTWVVLFLALALASSVHAAAPVKEGITTLYVNIYGEPLTEQQIALYKQSKGVEITPATTTKYLLPSWASSGRSGECLVQEADGVSHFVDVWGVWGRRSDGSKICYLPVRRGYNVCNDARIPDEKKPARCF